MNKELRKMAEEANLIGVDIMGDYTAGDKNIEAFARLVAADCANMVADIDDGEPVRWMAEKCAEIIRAKYGIKP